MVLDLYEPKGELFPNCYVATGPDSADTFPIDCYKSPAWISHQAGVIAVLVWSSVGYHPLWDAPLPPMHTQQCSHP